MKDKKKPSPKSQRPAAPRGRSASRTADAASRDTHKIKMAELFAEKVGEVFSGIVTGSTRYGLFVMLDDTCAEGMLSLRSLDDERRLMSIGKRVAVRVAAVDVTRGHIDLSLA